jgi:TonB family protein
MTVLPMQPAWADDIEKQIKFEYLEKVLTLRHFYSGEHLKFQSDGALQGSAPIGPWTLDGQIEVEDLHLHGAQVVIKGRRIHRIRDAQGNLADQLSTIDISHDKKQKELEKELRRLKVEIEIELPSEKPGEKDVASAIHAVFLGSSESMMDVVPGYWQAYFAKQEGKPQSALHPKKEPVSRVGGGVSPPRAILRPDPEYSDEARKARYQGTVVVSLIVDASGTPADVQITTPIGMGLDEKAIAAIGAWKFEPSQKDGQPIAVAVNIEVSFRLY